MRSCEAASSMTHPENAEDDLRRREHITERAQNTPETPTVCVVYFGIVEGMVEPSSHIFIRRYPSRQWCKEKPSFRHIGTKASVDIGKWSHIPRIFPALQRATSSESIDQRWICHTSTMIILAIMKNGANLKVLLRTAFVMILIKICHFPSHPVEHSRNDWL